MSALGELLAEMHGLEFLRACVGFVLPVLVVLPRVSIAVRVLSGLGAALAVVVGVVFAFVDVDYVSLVLAVLVGAYAAAGVFALRCVIFFLRKWRGG